jgi:CheY-like chemotaxis protein
MLRRNPDIDLLITDQAMPGMTGTELAEHATLLRPDLPIILATGYAELPTGTDANLPRLAKPYRQDALAHAITNAVRTRRDASP